MKPLPQKIEACPIIESVLEIRFSSKFPSDAIFGIIYKSIEEDFSGDAPKTLPILQLPEQLRNNDPNLKYQPFYKLSRGNVSLSIGPKTVMFSNLAPYVGWNDWSNFFNNILEKIDETKVFSQVERFGLRYINSFNSNLLQKINIEFKINNKSYYENPLNIRTEIHDDELVKILQLVNVLDPTNKMPDRRTIIDIDCIHNLNQPSDQFFKNYMQLIEHAHNKEKELFFSLLSDELLLSLKPSYGG
ncbi:MAG: TIGR04255 family protein [Ignavibacteriae bacterium]|nr:TIGR04255 family protein [Ignavibacteriota bacterium]NOG98369.1 TIGR04255 family protein [Ignavibacteriota bacterium]